VTAPRQTTLSVRDLDRTADAPPWIDRLPRSRLRCGSSICEHLLPSVPRLASTLDSAAAAGVAVELATPPVRDLARVAALLDPLSEATPEAEVVVNDWGVLRLVQRRYTSLRPVAGRQLVRAMADPRLASLDAPRFGTPDWPRAWRQGAAASPAWLAMVSDAGVRRLEIDWGPCGPDLADWEGTGMALTLHLPLALVATGRFCVHLSPRGPVDLASGPCPGPCLDRPSEVRVRGAQGDTVSVLCLGNAEAARIDATELGRVRTWLDSPHGPDRIAVRNGAW